MKITLEQREKNSEVLNAIYQKSWSNDKFKADFIKNPKTVLEKEYGKSILLNDGKDKIVIEDQSDSAVIYLNIPANQEVDMELTQEELELVAGGVVCGGLCVAGIFVAAGALGFFATAEL